MLRPPYQGLGQMRLLEVAGAVIPLTHAQQPRAWISSSPIHADADAGQLRRQQMLEAPIGRADAFGVGKRPTLRPPASEARAGAFSRGRRNCRIAERGWPVRPPFTLRHLLAVDAAAGNDAAWLLAGRCSKPARPASISRAASSASHKRCWLSACRAACEVSVRSFSIGSVDVAACQCAVDNIPRGPRAVAAAFGARVTSRSHRHAAELLLLEAACRLGHPAIVDGIFRAIDPGSSGQPGRSSLSLTTSA